MREIEGNNGLRANGFDADATRAMNKKNYNEVKSCCTSFEKYFFSV